MLEVLQSKPDVVYATYLFRPPCADYIVSYMQAYSVVQKISKANLSTTIRHFIPPTFEHLSGTYFANSLCKLNSRGF